MEHRQNSIQKRCNLSKEDTEKLFDSIPEKREKFINTFLNCNVKDTSFYNSIYNSEKTSIKNIGDSVIGYIKQVRGNV